MQNRRGVLLFILHSAFCILTFSLPGCGDKPAAVQKEVVIYTSVDQPVAEPILKAFEAKTGIKVIAKFDTEATKSVGLAERLRAERDNSKADVWWGNEIFLTINLARDGVLAAYESPAAADVPMKFRDLQHRWAANGMRVRVIAVGNGETGVTTIGDLIAPAMRDRIVMARPVAGTTTGHVAALYAVMGEEKADAYFRGLFLNGVKLVGGNSLVAQGIAQGQFAIGLTDNDDVDAAIADGGKLSAVLPDQGEGRIGTLAIPCTVAQVAGTQHAGAGRQLIDYLLSKEVEQQLIAAKFVKYSVRAGPGEIRTMDLDYAKAAEIFPQATRRALTILEGRSE